MSDSKLNENKEYRVLLAMKSTLTCVVKDTATPPGMKHPLGEETVENIRQCLMLISSREQELLEIAGELSGNKPRFIDEPSNVTAIPVDSIKVRKSKDS
ncbi:MAG: segregation and condensation protein A [Proteobacteria bacterium]|nr:segregation and condensation protein A [Pseudomonadota bacterium]